MDLYRSPAVSIDESLPLKRRGYLQVANAQDARSGRGAGFADALGFDEERMLGRVLLLQAASGGEQSGGKQHKQMQRQGI